MISASQLPGVRDELRSFIADGWVEAIIRMHVVNGGDVEFPSPEANQPLDTGIAAFQRRLASMVDTAELFHVSAEMTAIAAEAGLSMPGYRLHRDDLPAESGLIVFDAPIGVSTHEEMVADPKNLADVHNIAAAERLGVKLFTVEVVAALWRFAADRDGQPGVLVTLWSPNADLADHWESYGELDLAAFHRSMGYLNYHDEAVLPFDNDRIKGQPVRHDALRTLIATWLLMGQPIVSSDPEPLSRQVRRARERAGQSVPPVRVVKLRQAGRPRPEPAVGGETASGRVYRNRWVVRGHWRNQWYPSRKDHRPVYVPSHIKGPEGTDLIGTEKVYDWRQ